MRAYIKQCGTLAVIAVTGACCLGLPLVLSAVIALGLGFMLNDLILVPLFYAALAVNVFLLYRRIPLHRSYAAIFIGLIGAVIAALMLWTPLAVVVYLGLLMVLGAGVLDLLLGGRTTHKT
ncbi:MAG: hypothetical protein MJK10_16765 [Pseudomonadales bacterium]|nr:hypothetical protein [Pseudomonadales bacterium]NRA17786.1 MerC domain-containing protein [Oceanospirillaceae bacterium]